MTWIPFDLLLPDEQARLWGIAHLIADAIGAPRELLRPKAYKPGPLGYSNIKWPIDEFIIRRKVSRRSTLARLRRLNANGVEEGEMPRGYHPTLSRRGWGIYNDTASRGYVIRELGRDALAKLKSRGGGKRGCYYRVDIENLRREPDGPRRAKPVVEIPAPIKFPANSGD